MNEYSSLRIRFEVNWWHFFPSKFSHTGRLAFSLLQKNITHSQNILIPVHKYYDKLKENFVSESHLTKFTMELKIDVTISDDLSLSIGYNTFKSKVHIVVSMKPLNMSVCLSVCRATFLKE